MSEKLYLEIDTRGLSGREIAAVVQRYAYDMGGQREKCERRIKTADGEMVGRAWFGGTDSDRRIAALESELAEARAEIKGFVIEPSYTAVCSECGMRFDDGEFCGWSDWQGAENVAQNAGWFAAREHEADKVIGVTFRCQDCRIYCVECGEEDTDGTLSYLMTADGPVCAECMQPTTPAPGVD